MSLFFLNRVAFEAAIFLCPFESDHGSFSTSLYMKWSAPFPQPAAVRHTGHSREKMKRSGLFHYFTMPMLWASLAPTEVDPDSE